MALRKYGVRGSVGPAKGFVWAEVACKDVKRTLPEDRWMRRRFVRSARNLNRVRGHIQRDYAGQKITISITSWYRTPAYNKKIGGASLSQHVAGRATDFTVLVDGKQLSPKTVAQYAELVPAFAKGGIGHYDKKHGYFTHVDTRPEGPARWVNG